MRKGVRIAVILVVIIAIALGYELYRNREPRYHGHVVTYWIHRAQAGEDPGWAAATEAVLACGTNAIPFYIKLLQTKHDGPLRDKLGQFLAAHDLPTMGLTDDRAENNRWNGCGGIATLGPKAKSAIPALAKLLKSPDEDQVIAAGAALTSIGLDGIEVLTNMLYDPTAPNRFFAALCCRDYTMPNEPPLNPHPSEYFENAARSLVPALIFCLNDPDVYLQMESIRVLGRFAKSPETVVPILINRIENAKNEIENGDSIATVSIYALGKYGITAVSAVPVLLASFNGTNRTISRAAGGALVRIDESAGTTVISNYLNIAENGGLNIRDRTKALGELRELGKYAKSAGPAVLVLFRDVPKLSSTAEEALKAIDPETAVRSGMNLTDVFDGGGSPFLRADVIEAIHALEKYGESNRLAVPALLHAFRSESRQVRREAGIALKKIAPEEAAKSGVE